MAYRVKWSPKAEQELAALWLGTRSRYRMTEATQRLESGFLNQPLQLGESRSGNLRIAIDDMLACSYEVDEGQRTVLVISIWKQR